MDLFKHHSRSAVPVPRPVYDTLTDAALEVCEKTARAQWLG